ncbi:MAG: UvrD-helicase domain-containing protein [Candidatus Rokubacteria bacterium]|nr:UvrD-helicase domain-containing protein [Candidatus Rokubacteria bacterium]
MAGNLTPLVDQDDRNRIRHSLDETLVVEAAAGTGKTSEMVARLVNVLAEGRGTVDSIAALTFTEKAAGELKLRLRAGLEEARREAAGEKRQRLEDAIARLEEARVSTIHGFCNELLHERPVEARVDPRFEVLTEPKAEALYARAFDAWLGQTLEDPPEGVRRALRRRATDGDPVDRLRRAGWQLAEWRDFREPWTRREFDRRAAIDAVAGRVLALHEALKTCTTTADTFFADMWPLRRLAEDTRARENVVKRDYDGLESALIDLSRDWKFTKPRTGAVRNYKGGLGRDAILAMHGELVAALNDFRRDADADLAALLQQELLATVDRYQDLKTRTAALDFVDLLLRARDLLRDRRDVRAEMQARLTHVFVDEFQDTDPLQAEILLLLAASDPSIDRWQDVTPAPGKLFIVGDPKQSIYRFRRADVGTYQAVKDQLQHRGAACLKLTTSFRATPSVQRFVNAAFAPVMQEDHAALQAGYVPLAPFRDEQPGQPAVVALPVPRPYGYRGLTKTAVDGSTPDAVAAFVAWLVNESGWTVTEREHPGERRPISARHVCLLFRRFTHFGADVTRPYVEALEARGIPHLLVGGRSFHLREEVESLRTALAAIEWPDDELSVYATLKGPLFALGDEELVDYRQRWRRLHPYRLPREDVPAQLKPVVDALSLLRSLHGLRNYRPVEETINRLLTATRAHAAFVLRPWGEQALANVLRVAELARTYEASGGISFRGFVDQLREEAEGEAPEAPIVEESSEGVRLMTVHKAKGLEFSVVVLADITAGVSGNPNRYVDPARGLCALRLGGWQPWDVIDHEEEELARERAEGVRVAYVAATRARDLLVVPTIGDDPFAAGWDAATDGWIAPVHAAMYPPAELRRVAQPAPACPAFGDDSVLERSDGHAPGRDNVQPGRHVFGDYDVVWWDPRCLKLDVTRVYGLRREELIADPGRDVVEADRARYDAWLEARRQAQEAGAVPTIRVKPVTEWTREKPDGDAAPDVTLVEIAAAVDRATGPRFGTLVHVALATVALDANAAQVAESVALQARILGAPPEEIAAATAVVGAALAHPLLAPAREAWRSGRCRRETPVAMQHADGTLLEGVLDIAWEDDDGWTVVDFKTDADLAAVLPAYRRQVALYASAIERTTGRPVRAMLMRV